ncbi:cytosine-purine permease [Dacryopinax primogenitus]|uniref:Cytosine-purine permease n=1 Tax=Dacryopinax primogenitus (strain DJM 731) TaxID=1858805 RepID=M5FVH1_DACPD|nr:cytosine-purine permease [Dacryopinax primogenitus]EJU01806.1 cytosine-purine permease [Dacryopinax primogenitus]
MPSLRQRLAPIFTFEYWELSPEPCTFAPSSKWSNADMDPTPLEKRTWTTFNYITYWISDAFNVATWDMASALLASGLSWHQALPCIVLGHALIACAITANGTIGARLHIPFPVLNRSSFGFWFSYFSVVSRVVLAMFWFAIQTYTGSECVYQMLRSLFPSFLHMPNHLPPSANITSAELLCYFLYWLIQFPFLLIPSHKIRWLFAVKSVAVTAAGVSMMVWAFVETGGAGAIIAQPARVSGSALAWTWLGGLNSVIGNYATLSVNIPDFTRLAKHPRHQYVQLLIIPLAFTFIAFQGLVVTSAGYILYGDYYWDPLRLINNWDNRPAAFFASFAFCLATLGTNIGANSISAANDFMALLPRWLNIRRGQILCALIGGWVIIPWEILATATGFLNFMGGYTVFLGPICAIMIVDYWFVKHQKIDVPALYDPHGRYRYTAGINWRAGAALLVSVPPNLPGLINAINPSIEVGGGIYPYDIAWMLGFTLAGVTYYVTSWLWPAKGTLLEHAIDVDEAAALAREKHEREKDRGAYPEETKEEELNVGVREV